MPEPTSQPLYRYALKIEYDGRPFCGWQRQRELSSVQGAVEQALARIEPTAPTIAAAGRTDTGVHAYGQVAHVDLTRAWDPDKLMGALNYHLKPNPVAITAAAQTAPEFHARFDATGRRYLFRLVSRRAPAIHDAGKIWQVGHPLDIDAMRAGAAHLIGLHDFTTFRAVGCQAKSPVKTLDSLEIEQLSYPGGTEYRFHLAARSFLHNQVRSFVGTLERVGAGAWPPAQVKSALEACDRAACGPVCPPHGLYLVEATYPAPLFP